MNGQSGNKAPNKVSKFLSSKWGEFIVLSALSALALLFTVIFYSIKFTDFSYDFTERSEMSFWSSGTLYIDFGKYRYINNFNVGFIIAFFVGLALFLGAAAIMAAKKDKRLFYAAAAFNMGLCLVCLILGALLGILRSGAIVCCIFSMFVSMAIFAFLILRRYAASTTTAEGDADGNTAELDRVPPLAPKTYKAYKLILLICECVAAVILFVTFLIPVFSQKGVVDQSYVLIKALSSDDYPLYLSVAFIVMFTAFFAEILYLAVTVSAYFRSDRAFLKQSKRFIISASVFTLVYFVLGYCLAFYTNVKSAEAERTASTVSFIPFILSSITLFVYSVVHGKLALHNPDAVKGGVKPFKAEPLFFIIAITAVTFISLVLDIIKVRVEVGEFKQQISLSGYELLTKYKDLESGFQLLAFIEFTFLLSSGILLLTSVICFFAKAEGYYKMTKVSAIANFMFVLIFGLYGIYFKIGQRINMENIESLLKIYELSLPEDFVYEVKSQTILMLIGSFAIIFAMLLRGIFNLKAERVDDEIRIASADGLNGSTPRSDLGAETAAENGAATAVPDFDACPAFTELDGKQNGFRAALEERRRHLFDEPTLPALVRFVVDYARECRLHLSYSVEDIAAFVAGLGSSRLAILQGMSGTGKTSLPKVFTEAIMGNCEIVEVESSWRDKNELLGYYNEFSKCFTPKKFTQCLYKARLNPSVTTFIVLDEMNLSRIEYYFSDFLSLMENEENKREIKLLNIKLHRTENGEKIPYAGLTDGHTIKVPANVWFIGTANRDESTFEISDKVYDRAMTMNFNKRAPKIHSLGAPLSQRFVPYGMLVQLFNDAKSSYNFEAEDNALIQKAEKLLVRYNISFGNRILKQMEDFVKIYCACFGDKTGAENDAVERILLTKVVSKLETKVVENKEAFATEFDKLGLKNCGAFIRKLNED